MSTDHSKLAKIVLASAMATDAERELAAEVLRLRIVNQKLEFTNSQLESQHKFALESWQQAVKRSGKLSADLEHSKVELARATTAAAIAAEPSVVIELTPDDQKTRLAPYTAVLDKKLARGTGSVEGFAENSKTVVVQRRPPPLPAAAYAMPPTMKFTPPRRRATTVRPTSERAISAAEKR